MPPKKPKKTKEELEAERLAEEAEAAKQAAIAAKKAAEEESKRKIEEAKLAEERRVTRAAEVSRLEEEYAKYLELLKDKQAQRQAESALQKSRFEWGKFRDPTDQPDASSERDMNTFLSIMLETKCESMTEMLGIVKNIEGIASAAEDSWFESFARKDVEAQARLHAYLGEFSSLVLEKIDQATASFLHSIKNHLNTKLELEVEELARGVSIGMWGSLQEGSTMRPARKSVQLEKMGLQFDIPKQVLQQNPFVHRVVKIPFDMFSGGAYAPIPTTNKLVLSDLIYIDILIPPALPYLLRAKKWLIQDSSEGEHGLRKVSYPSSVPCKFYIKVPEDLIMSDDVKVALWNSDSKEWAEDAVTDFQYSESTRLVQFLMSTVGMLAFVRNRNADFPYKRWSLGPVRNSNDAVSEQRARFTLNTQRFEVVIDIVGSSCCLAKSFNKSVNSLVGVKMPPGVLLGKLQKRGVCIMPVDADLAAINSTLPEPLLVKRADVEHDVLREIAKCSSALDFASSEHWTPLAESQVGLVVRESTAYSCVVESFDYECILAEQDVVSDTFRNAPGSAPITGVGESACKHTLVFGNEYGNRRGFDNKPRPGEVSHLELATAIGSRCTPEARERIERCNELFQETVFSLLSLVRPFSFTY